MIRMFALVAVLAATCNPTPNPPPQPPVSDATPAPPVPTPSPTPTIVPDASDPAEQACALLRTRKCALGSNPNCQQTMRLPARFGVVAGCVIDAGTSGSLAPCNVSCSP